MSSHASTNTHTDIYTSSPPDGGQLLLLLFYSSNKVTIKLPRGFSKQIFQIGQMYSLPRRCWYTIICGVYLKEDLIPRHTRSVAMPGYLITLIFFQIIYILSRKLHPYDQISCCGGKYTKSVPWGSSKLFTLLKGTCTWLQSVPRKWVSFQRRAHPAMSGNMETGYSPIRYTFWKHILDKLYHWFYFHKHLISI